MVVLIEGIGVAVRPKGLNVVGQREKVTRSSNVDAAGALDDVLGTIPDQTRSPVGCNAESAIDPQGLIVQKHVALRGGAVPSLNKEIIAGVHVKRLEDRVCWVPFEPGDVLGGGDWESIGCRAGNS